jgi:hypothetical protein
MTKTAPESGPLGLSYDPNLKAWKYVIKYRNKYKLYGVYSDYFDAMRASANYTLNKLREDKRTNMGLALFNEFMRTKFVPTKLPPGHVYSF